MRRLAFFFVCLFSTIAAAPTLPARAVEPAESATAVVEKLHSALLEAMKAGTKNGFEGRRAILDPVVRDVYDLPAMARVATGAAWQKLSDEDKSQVIAAFSAWTVATYTSQFKSFGGESFQVKGEAEAARGRRAVDTALIVKGEDPVQLVYQLHLDGDRWRIVDVDAESVSQLALRRNEFAAVLAKSGVSGLIEQMKNLTAQLAKGG